MCVFIYSFIYLCVYVRCKYARMPIDSRVIRDGLWLTMCKFCAGRIRIIGSTYEQDQKIVAMNGCKLYLFFNRYCTLEFCRNLSHTAPHSGTSYNQSVPEGSQCVPVDWCTSTYTEIEARDGKFSWWHSKGNINKNPTRCNSRQSNLFYCQVTLHVSGAHSTHHQEY